mgnify:CR=1 FL=1
MKDADRRFLVSKIISGIVFLDYKNETFIINEPTVRDKYIAETMYMKHLDEALEKGVLPEEEVIEELIGYGMWSEEEEKLLDKLPEQIEDIKVDLYKSYTNFRSSEVIRKALSKKKQELNDLLSKKNIYRKETAEGTADGMKLRYLITSNITKDDGEIAWPANKALEQDAGLSDAIMMTYLSKKITEEGIRELSRTEPWRSIWSAGKAEHTLFGTAAINITDEQQKITAWSRVYDNIYESPECPPDEVVEDDDMLDGWLILQNKNRKQQRNRKSSEKSTNVKGNEVFFVADTKKDAQRIYDLNDSEGRRTIKQRDRQVEKTGDEGLDASKTFDAQIELTALATQKFKNMTRNK